MKIHGWSMGDDAEALHGSFPWKDPDPVTSAADGKFEVSFEASPTQQIGLDVFVRGRVPRTGRWSDGLEPGQVLDLGDVRLPLGWTVSGKVVDQRGEPVPRITIGLDDLPLPLDAGAGANSVRYGTAGEDGIFELAVPIPAGTWPLNLPGGGWNLVKPSTVTVKEGDGATDLVVTVRRMPSISGVLVDENGRGIQGLLVEVRYPPDFQDCVPPRLHGGRMASSWTRADGSYVIHAHYDDSGPLRLAYGPREKLVLNPDGRTFEWGESGVRLVYRRRPALELAVVEAQTGKPVEEFSVKCHLQDANNSAATDARLGGKHEGGRVVIDAVEPGVNHLVVIPKEADLVPTQTIAFEAPEAGPLSPMRVEVERATPFSIRLTGPSGKPIGGSKVELLRPHPENPVRVRAETWVVDHRSEAIAWTTEGNFPVLISSAEADESGIAALRGPCGAKGFILRIVGSKHPPIVRGDFVVPKEGETAQVVAGAPTGIRGRIVPEAVRSLGLQLLATGVTDPSSWRETSVPIGPDGAFEVGGLEPGEWEIALQCPNPFTRSPSSLSSLVRLDPPLGSFRLAEGEMKEVEFDATRYAPGFLRGAVHSEEALRASPKLWLEVRTESFSGTAGELPLDEEGRFGAQALFPAEYRLFLAFPDGTTREDAEWFTVGPGENVVREFRPKAR